MTNDEKIADDMRMYRNYGSEKRYYNKVVGTNSRLDEIQAGLLRVRLKHVQELTDEKKEIGARYQSRLHNPLFTLPPLMERATHIYHQFVIRCKERGELISYLKEKEIGTIIHYPIPPHLAEAYAYLGFHEGDLPLTEACAREVLSIPVYNGMTKEEQDYVIDVLNAFQGRS